MKSGLEGRNNPTANSTESLLGPFVSMKSGLEGRNNLVTPGPQPPKFIGSQ
mgnify:CR=1 FL=1